MRYRFQGVSAVAAATILALLGGGCAHNQGQASPGPVEKHDLTVGFVPVADAAALYIAQQRGFFQAEGLHVKLVPIRSGADAISGQLAGKYDVVLGNYVSYILADATQHQHFRILAPAAADAPDVSMLLVPAGSPIQSIAGLAGKTVGVNALNNIGTLFITSMLSDNGMHVQTDHVQFKAVPFPDMTHALQADQVDAAWMVEPFVTAAEMAGAKPLADTNTGATQNLPIAGYMVTQAWEQRYPNTAAAFRAALAKGQQIAASNSPAVWRGLETFANIKPSDAEIIALPSFPLTIQAGSLQRIANLMLLYNMIDQGFNAAKMLR